MQQVQVGLFEGNLYLQCTCSRSTAIVQLPPGNRQGCENGTKGLLMAMHGRQRRNGVHICSPAKLPCCIPPPVSHTTNPIPRISSQPFCSAASGSRPKNGPHQKNHEGSDANKCKRINLRCNLMQGECEAWPPPPLTTSPRHERSVWQKAATALAEKKKVIELSLGRACAQFCID
jgi:hypothetical protein